MVRKRRTREHVIADLSANHVERYALRCGFTVERIVHDYGIDLTLSTYSASGEIENGLVYIQLKATDRLRVRDNQPTIAFQVRRADLELWLRDPLPCILIVYDARADVAYWLYVQAYFAQLISFNLAEAGETVTVHLPKTNVVDEAAIRRFAQHRDNVLAQMQGVIHHYD